MLGRANRQISTLALASALANLSCSGNDADVQVDAVEVLGVMPTPDGIVGRDGGVSGRFQGRSVWVYGDSVTTEAGTYPNTWRNNTMSWTDDLDASDGIAQLLQPVDETGAPREFFPRTDEEDAFNALHLDHGDGTCDARDDQPCGARLAIWGSGPVQDLPRGRALLTYGKVHAAPGEFNFSIIGTSLAVWTDFERGPERPLVNGTLDDPRLLFEPSEGEFAIPVAHDDFLYLFSCSGTGAAAHTCRLARAELDHVLQRSAWRFRGDGDWVASAHQALDLFQGSPNMTVHFNSQLGRWLALYITWGKIVLRSASELEGPWSDEIELYTPPEDNALHALAHAEFQERRGAAEYVSYLAGDQFRLLRMELSRPP
jgi:hypothetical protein